MTSGSVSSTSGGSASICGLCLNKLLSTSGVEIPLSRACCMDCNCKSMDLAVGSTFLFDFSFSREFLKREKNVKENVLKIIKKKSIAIAKGDSFPINLLM